MLQFISTAIAVALFIHAGKLYERNGGFSLGYWGVLALGVIPLTAALMSAKAGV